ncbi:MAG: hypothetical protein HZB68_00695 [Candidatus Aenigmarchaeota archaeon]|nr:hypothetical protein [Candidatus Aenigmarchaeota archaeon]
MNSFEGRVVSSYIDSILDARNKSEKGIRGLGYTPQSLWALFSYMEKEVGEYFGNLDKIMEDREKKLGSREKALEEQIILREKVKEGLGGEIVLLFDDGLKAGYHWELGRYVLTPSMLYQFIAGGGADFKFHESRHREQKEKYGNAALGLSAFLEGDAEFYAVENLSKPAKGPKELARNYIALTLELADCLACKPEDEEYVDNLLSPAIIFHMKNKGHSDEDIKSHFDEASKKSASNTRQALLEGL